MHQIILPMSVATLLAAMPYTSQPPAATTALSNAATASVTGPLSVERTLHAMRAAPPKIALVAGADAASMHAAIRDSDELAAFAAAESALASADEQLADARASTWRGDAQTDLSPLKQTASDAITAHATAQADLLAFVFTHLEAAAGARDAALARRAHANWARSVPVAAKVLDLSEADWLALEAAFGKRESGAPMNADEQRVIAIYDSSADASLVASRLAAGQAEYDAYIASLAAELAAAQ